MHEDFPMDPVTIAILAIAVLAALVGYLGNGALMALVFFGAVLLTLLLFEWVGFFVKDYTEGSR